MPPLKLIDTLIDKQDGFEVVRDQIAAILAAEVVNQMTLAAIELKNPALWDLRIFIERHNPWEQFLNLTDASDKSPIVNVWFDNGNPPKNQGGVVNKQAYEGNFNIDCYGVGVSSDDEAGHKPGDREAALNAQRALRLVRNILMAGTNTHLQLRQKDGGIVGMRWIRTEEMFQPQIDNQSAQKVVGARLSLEVKYEEASPQVTPETLEAVQVDIKRKKDGQVIAEADFEYPLP